MVTHPIVPWSEETEDAIRTLVHSEQSHAGMGASFPSGAALVPGTTTARIALVVQGLFELSDSIGYDCVGEYKLLRELIAGRAEIRIFAENIRPTNYPDLSIESIDRLWPWVEKESSATVIYHYCDGWAAFEARFVGLKCRRIVRWHNNTPPWFLAPYSMDYTARSTRGFRNTLRIAAVEAVEFWANSFFSARQLSFLGVEERRIRVVYPISRFLAAREKDAPAPAEAAPAPSHERDETIRILFVGRICPHKGHKHLVATCAALKRLADCKVELVIAGRPDPALQSYLDDARRLARDLSVPLRIAGEVTEEALRRLYASASVFLCLSEHEGFGLPVFEAMRMGVPVVAWRSTAVGELLRSHPLAMDSLDYSGLARRILAACDPTYRGLLVAWQKKHVLGAYNAGIVAGQLLAGLKRADAAPRRGESAGEDVLEQPPLPPLDPLPDGWENPPEIAALSEIARDTAERLMTRHDLDSYLALLERSRISFEADFFHRAMATRFHSDRPILGSFLRMLRRATLSTQSGIVSAVAMLEQDLFGRADKIEAELRELRGAFEAFCARERAPANGTAVLAAAARDPTAIFYDAPYFNGDGQYSGYFCYTRGAVAPSRELAKTLFELFRPASALDAGCAAGYTVAALRDLGVDASGIDISEWAIKEARSPFVGRLDISTQVIEGSFDLVIAYDVIDHIAPERLAFAMQNLWRATAGWLVMVPGLHNEGTTFDRSEPMHQVFHDRDWWQSFLEQQCGVPLDRVATAALSNTDHSRAFGYQGRIFVVRKPHLRPKPESRSHAGFSLGPKPARTNGHARPTRTNGHAKPTRPEADTPEHAK